MATILSIVVLIVAAILWGCGLWPLMSLADALDDRHHGCLALFVSVVGYLVLCALVAGGIVAALFAIWGSK